MISRLRWAIAYTRDLRASAHHPHPADAGMRSRLAAMPGWVRALARWLA